MQQKVLQSGIIDSVFIFGKWTQTGNTETHLTYLGAVTTKKGHTFKILNNIWFWGLSHRATSCTMIFSSNNRYIGNYRVTVTSDLPVKMRQGKLIFENTDEDCDKKLITVVDLRNGLPKTFFRKCKGAFGDIYGFSSD